MAYHQGIRRKVLDVVESMSVLEAIRRRRAVSDFRPEKIPDDVLRQVVEAGYLAPTGGNYPSRELVVITDRVAMDGLAATHKYCGWLAQTEAAIALIGNPVKSRYWVEDCGVAGAHIWLAAVSLGVAGGWAAMYLSDNAEESERRESQCRQILNVPVESRVVGIIGLGYAASIPPVKEKATFEQVVHFGAYGRLSED